MKKRVLLVLVVAVTIYGGLALADEPKMVSVIDKYLDKRDTFNLSLFQTTTINDSANTGMGTGLSFGYYINAWFGLGVEASYDYAITNMGEFNKLFRGKTNNGFRGLWTSVSQPLSTVALLTEWSPLYQKMNLFELAVVRTYLTCYLGPTMVATRQYYYFEREDDVFSFGGQAGIGGELILTKHLSIELKISDLVYSEKVTLLNPQRMDEYQTKFRLKNRINAGLSLNYYF